MSYYLIVVHAMDEVVLPAESFAASSGAAATRSWQPVAEYCDIFRRFEQRLDGVHELACTSSGHTPSARTFLCHARTESVVESLLHALAVECGVGNENTPACGSVSVLSTDMTRPAPGARFDAASAAEGARDSDMPTWTRPGLKMLADKVLLRILAGTVASFDSYALVGMASLLAAVGLGTNNPIVIVSSMLVSPLMGPVLGITFGLFVRDVALVRRALALEVAGLLISFALGAVTGAAFSPFAASFGWPNAEMSSRGDPWNLVIGIVVASPSGAGAALSMTGDNTSSLVGVAIAASLLPPVVNAGMCGFLALASATYLNNKEQARIYAVIGAYSLLLTLINIVCIILGAMAAFALKHSAPLPSRGLLFRAVIAEVDGSAWLATDHNGAVEHPASGRSRTQPAPDQRPIEAEAVFTVHAEAGRQRRSDLGATFDTVAAGPYGARLHDPDRMSLQEAVARMQAAGALRSSATQSRPMALRSPGGSSRAAAPGGAVAAQ